MEEVLAAGPALPSRCEPLGIGGNLALNGFQLSNASDRLRWSGKLCLRSSLLGSEEHYWIATVTLALADGFVGSGGACRTRDGESGSRTINQR